MSYHATRRHRFVKPGSASEVAGTVLNPAGTASSGQLGGRPLPTPLEKGSTRSGGLLEIAERAGNGRLLASGG